MKGCLKLSQASRTASSPSFSPNSASSSSARPKCNHTVSFREKCEDEVHPADDWDRSPVDVAHKLSYDDVLELKEMQVAAARACARAHAAAGSSSRYLSNVPLGLLPLLPETGIASGATAPPATPTSPHALSPSRSPPGTPGTNASSGKSIGLTLAEVCLCRVFSADTGTPAANAYGHHSSCTHHQDASKSNPPLNSGMKTQAQMPIKLNVTHQIPSPPDTPPRAMVTSIPPPPPTARARNFSFLPLLDSSTSSSPSSSPSSTPSSSGVDSPVLSPRVTSPPPSTLRTRSGISSPLSSSSSSSVSSSGAYTAYDPYAGLCAVGWSATLGLERKLGLASDSDSGSSEEEGEEEDKDWPHDWPGRHALHRHHQRHHHHNVRKDTRDSSNLSANASTKQPPTRTQAPTFPPSPPAEPSPLPNPIPVSNSGGGQASPRSSTPKPLSSSPGRSSRTSSPSSRSPRSSSSPSKARKMALPLVTLA